MRLVLVFRQYRARLGLVGKLRVHPLFVLLVLCAVGFGMWQDVITLFVIVMLHELGHALVAEALGYDVEAVSLLPFGGVMRLSHARLGFHPKHEAAIAIAGPVVNLLIAIFAWGLYAAGISSEKFFHLLVQLNVWIAAFNLLPAMPLDGGRILRAARSRKVGFECATLEGYRMAYVIAALLLALGGLALWSGTPHFGILILGVFLLVSAYTGRRDVRMDTIRFLDAKKKQLSARPQEVLSFAATGTTTIRDVVKRFAPDRYHMVYVLDDSGNVKTLIEEDEILEAVFAGRLMDSLDSWIHRAD
jgi:stage IV sporulation protein FB